MTRIVPSASGQRKKVDMKTRSGEKCWLMASGSLYKIIASTFLWMDFHKATLKQEVAAAPPEPAPPEPFDNSTYKNLQHHNYNHYTFADLDLEMAKYRLPQPSSGRPSPRH